MQCRVRYWPHSQTPGWCFTSLAICFLLTPALAAQENVEPTTDKPSGVTVKLPVFAETKVSTVVSVPDGGTVILAGRRYRTGTTTQSSHRLLAPYRDKNPPQSLRYKLCSKSKMSNATTYDIIHDFKPLKIVTHESGKIEMKLVRHYNNDNLDALQQDHPEIAMHINALPKELSEYARVKLSLDVESDVSVDSLLELKDEHPSLFKIYERWVVAGEK